MSVLFRYIEIYDVTDWKIFYADENNIFIITSDLVENSKIINFSGFTKYNTYSFGRGSVPKSTIEDVRNDDNKIFVDEYMKMMTNKNLQDEKHYTAAALLNSNTWGVFLDNDLAIGAVGGPPLEMIIEHLKQVNPSVMSSLSLRYSSRGYSFGKDGSDIIGGNYNGVLYSHSHQPDNSNGDYATTSPSDDLREKSVYSVGPKQTQFRLDRDGFGAETHYLGIRPVVALKPEINIKKMRI